MLASGKRNALGLDVSQWARGASLAILAVGWVACLGCRESKQAQPAPVPEVAFADQLARLKAGTSDEIRFERSAVGSTELQQLDGLANLRALVLDAGVVADSDVRYLTKLTGLEHLRLRESPLGDAALVELAQGQLNSLLILNLPQARPTAVGLKALAALPKLRQLRIAGRQIDDAAIEELTQWPALSSLHLIQPGITARSLETLAGMARLSSLYVDECPLPDEAWLKLFAARPDLHVHIDQSHHDLDPHAHPNQ